MAKKKIEPKPEEEVKLGDVQEAPVVQPEPTPTPTVSEQDRVAYGNRP
jgi:hypothetical protein